MYFEECKNVAEVKSLYRKLAFKFHPDHGGDLEEMKNLNEWYHDTLLDMDGSKSVDGDNEYTYAYSKEDEEEIMNKIYDFLSLKMEKVEIALVGKWIWISGESKPHKKALKVAGCIWHGKRKMWYWRKATGKRYYSAPKKSFESIAAQYGFKSFSNSAPAPA